MKKSINIPASSTEEQSSNKLNRRKRRSGGRTGRRTKEMIAIARNRIEILMQLADTEAIIHKNPNRARRYVQMARSLGTRYNVRLEKVYNNVICRGCNTHLGPVESARIRIRGGKKVITCKHCGRIKRLRYR